MLRYVVKAGVRLPAMRLNVPAVFAVSVSAVLQTVIFPVAGPLPQWRALLAWVALVPWLWLLLSAKVDGWREVRNLTGWSYLCGALWYLGHCYWVFDTMHQYGGLSVLMAAMVLVLFCLYLGLYHALFGLLMAVLRFRRPGLSGWMVPVVPAVWVAVELARARVTSFPWDLLGYAQIDNAALTPLAPWAGTYALSFVLAAVNAAIAVALVRRGRMGRVLGGAGAALALVLGVAGYLVRAPKPPATQTAVLVQPNLEVGGKGTAESAVSLERVLVPLSLAPRQALRAEGEAAPVGTPRIVLWPESPAPFDTTQPELQGSLRGLAREAHAPVMAGALGVVEDARLRRGYRQYNSVMLVTPEAGYTARYDKIHLVPFGEFVPFAEVFWFAGGLTEAVGTFDRGSSRMPLLAGGHRYGLFVCYESIFGDEVRQYVQGGAQVLLNLSDDGWYGDTSAPFQHINMARMRAIENRRWVLRDTNTGITASIDPYGMVREWAPRHVRTAVTAHFSYADALTFYTEHGDLFAYGCAGVTVLLVMGALLGWQLE